MRYFENILGIILLLCLLMCGAIVSTAYGQSYGSLGYQLSKESEVSGNGIGNGFFVVGAFNPEALKQTLELKGEATVGWQEKNYLRRNAFIFRLTPIARFWIPLGSPLLRVAPQAGIRYGYTKIGGEGGYEKSGKVFFYGFGTKVQTAKTFTVLDYRYLPEIELLADSTVNGTRLDGYSKGQAFRVETIYGVKRYKLLFYGEYGNYTYRRAAIRYGAEPAKINHQYSTFDFGVGVAYK